jgi:hypothetical protein
VLNEERILVDTGLPGRLPPDETGQVVQNVAPLLAEPNG